MADTIIYLIRHGETAENAQRPFVLQGNAVNGPLSENGRRQAAALARTLESVPFAAVYASPMLRARQTAATLVGPRPLVVETVKAFEEVNVGQWEKLSWNQIREKYPVESTEFLANPGTVPYLGGESYVDVQARTLPMLNEVAEKHRGETIAIVAHNVVNKSILASILQLPISRARSLHQTNCCINILRWGEPGPEVEVVNSDLHVRHLPHVL